MSVRTNMHLLLVLHHYTTWLTLNNLRHCHPIANGTKTKCNVPKFVFLCFASATSILRSFDRLKRLCVSFGCGYSCSNKFGFGFGFTILN